MYSKEGQKCGNSDQADGIAKVCGDGDGAWQIAAMLQFLILTIFEGRRIFFNNLASVFILQPKTL